MEHVVVVGGGVMGSLTALNLLNEGLQVTLLDRRQLGKEASWAGGGIISPLYPWRYNLAVSALADWSQGYYPQLGEKLLATTGIDPEVTPCGLLWLDEAEQGAALAWATEHAKPLEKLDSARVYKQVPQLAAGFSGGLWQASLANVRNPRLMAALKAYLIQQPRFTLLENTSVGGLLEEAGKVAGIHHAAGKIRADAVVIAAGAWSGDWLAGLGLQVPVAPVKGQMLLFKGEPGWLPSIVLFKGRYAIPRRDGHILIGSTLEHSGYDTATTQHALDSLRQSAISLLPDLAQMQP
ncbi:MAG: NAD(P)/FAD-dependent oxidoreductase, partial [Pseudomonas sp.]